MKNSKKTVSILTLSLLAVVALASCGNSGGGTDKAGFHVYAISTDDDLKNDDCLTAEATSEIKYKKDLVISIKPNQYFSMRLDANTPIMPYVGLGNPITKYEFPLAKDVAWTYEDKSTPATGEEYVLTVKGEYFNKNVIISYGDRIGGVNYDEVQCEYNDYYLYSDPSRKTGLISPKNLTQLPLGCPLGTPEQPVVTDFFYTDSSKCKCSFARTFVTFAFKVSQDNLSPILDLDAYLATKPADAGGKTSREYSYIDVMGAYDESGSTQDKLDYYSDKEGEFKIRVEDNTIYVDIPWKDIITDGDHEYGKTHKYHHIDFKFDPVFMGHKAKDDEDISYGIETNFDSSIKNYRAGYLTEDVGSGKSNFYIYEASGQERYYSNKKLWEHTLFRQSGTTRFDYTNVSGEYDSTLFGSNRYHTYESSTPSEAGGHVGQLADISLTDSEKTALKNYIHPGFSQNAIDKDVLSGKYEYDVSAYSANFLWNQSPEDGTKWPNVKITLTNDAVGHETKTLEFTDEAKQTDWRNKYYSSQGHQLTHEELWYKETEDHNWRLVCLNRDGDRTIGLESFEYVNADPGTNNAYLLYSLKGTEPFKNITSVSIEVTPGA